MKLTSALNNRGTVAAFLFDKNHIMGFEVFYYSLYKTKSLQGIPKILITTDATLLDNRLLNNVFHRIIYLTPEQLVPFQSIADEAVHEKHRHELVAKYSFLKFNIFSEIAAKRILYFDVDMACLQNIDDLLVLTDADVLVAQPLSKRRLLNTHGKIKPKPQCEQVVERFCRDSSRYAAASARVRKKLEINSGVLSIGEKLIGPKVRDGLLAKANNGHYGYEQHVLRDYLLERGDASIRYLDASYNFPRRALDTTSVEYFARIRPRIRILHFNGGHPWNRGTRQGYVDFLWWDLYMESRPFIEALHEQRVRRFSPGRLGRYLR